MKAKKERPYVLAQITKAQREQIRVFIKNSNGKWRSITHVLDFALRQFIATERKKHENNH